MKKVFLTILSFLFFTALVKAQDDVYPAPQQKGILYITNATIHVGNGQVIDNGTIEIKDGKITKVGPGITASGNVIDAKGQQVYPGLILPNTDLGLREIAGNAVRGSNDFAELGDWNTNIRSIVAYNSDSRIIGTLRANGILLANVVPLGGMLPGSSTIVQLDAWNWEDAAYKMDIGIHFNMPSLLIRSGRGRFGGFTGMFQQGAGAGTDPIKDALNKIDDVKKFFREAKAYFGESSRKETNLKFEALKGLFDKKQKFYVHCDQVKQMLVAIDFAKEFGFNVVIVGGSESWQIADLLKQNNIAVILNREFNLPTLEDDDVDQPFKTPYLLKKAGVQFCLNDDFQEARYRNLPFNAGQAVAYGLSKEEALQAITLDAAKILGIDDHTGSIEAGKDANIVISKGDILDMRTSIITDAFIQGRKVSLENKQTQLYDRYMHKYGLTENKN
ncbi:MAG: amidohydrolase family protein [Bacteroidetes bacterium]|nr:amidohydrolase family protein [Bacteroidota bacterium]MBS1931129.1 amidohydrolase family protein [Bacteroidota bacterium]